MAQVRTPSPFVATPFKSAPQPKKPKAPSVTPTLPPPVNNALANRPAPALPNTGIPAQPNVNPLTPTTQPRTAISPFTGQPVPVLPPPVQQPTPTPQQPAPAAGIPTQTPKPPQPVTSKPPTPFQALPPQQATPATPAVPFESKAPQDSTDATQRISARVSKLAAPHQQAYAGLDHQKDLNSWNDSAFKDYLDMHANGDQPVMLDGVQMKGKDAAAKVRALMEGKKGKKGKPPKPTTKPKDKKGKGDKPKPTPTVADTADKRIQSKRMEAY